MTSEFTNKLWDFKPYNQKWVKVKRGRPATKKQRKFLSDLGWEHLDLTVGGASVLINAILTA